MREIERREPGDIAARLRPDQLQLIAAGLHQIAARLGADANPVDACLLYTSDAADERSSVDLGGRRFLKKKK